MCLSAPVGGDIPMKIWPMSPWNFSENWAPEWLLKMGPTLLSQFGVFFFKFTLCLDRARKISKKRNKNANRRFN